MHISVMNSSLKHSS